MSQNEDLALLAQRLDHESSYVGDNDNLRILMRQARDVIAKLAETKGSAIPEPVGKFLDKLGVPPSQESRNAVDAIFKGIIEHHKHLDQAMELVKEMQARVDADPALEFVLKTLQRAKNGGSHIDVIEIAKRAQPLRKIVVGEQGIVEDTLVEERPRKLIDRHPQPEVETLDQRLTRTIDLVTEMEQVPLHDPALKFVRETVEIMQRRERDMKDIVPISLQQIADRLRNRRGAPVGMGEVLEVIDALPGSLTKHRDLVGRGLVEPVVTYDPVVTEVKQYIENVQAARGYLSQADMPDQLEEVEDYLHAHLRWLMAPRHNLNPVLEVITIAQILRDMVNDEKGLPAHVMYDMANMANTLDKVAGQHAAAPVEVTLAGSGTRTVSRLEHTLEVLSDAAGAHPLDIDQQKLREVELWLKAIVLNNPGFKNLGQEGYILVPAGNNVPGRVVDAVNDYLIMYGQGTHNAEELRGQAARSGSAAICNMPEWFAQTYGHVSKGGFASLMYHTMLAVAAQDEPKGVYLSGAQVRELEEALKAGIKTAWTDFVESAEKKDAR